MAAARFEGERVARVRSGLSRRLARVALFFLLTLLPAAGVLPTIGVATGLDDLFRHLLGWWALAAPAFGVGALLTRIPITMGRGAIVVDGDRLRIDRAGARPWSTAIAEVDAGSYRPRTREVEITLRGGDRVEASMAPEPARALLEAAGVDAARRTVRVRLGDSVFLDAMSILAGPAIAWPITAGVVVAAATAIKRLGFRGFAPGALVVAVGYVLFVGVMWGLLRGVRAALGPTELVVGADGVGVVRSGRDDFVPYARLHDVAIEPRGVTLTLDDGRRVRARGRHVDADLAAEIRLRIEEARAAWQRGAEGAASHARLDRHGRDLEAWREALRATLANDGRYRDAPLAREDVARALASPATPAERRIGAAIALADGDEAGRREVRAAARAAANPKLRVALESVAEGDLDAAAIEEAMAEERHAAEAAGAREGVG